LTRIGLADFARLRRHYRRIAARNFCKSEIRLTGNRDCTPAAAAYDANPPAAPPNSRERDTISALAGARRRPLGAAVAQSRACGKDQAANTRRKSGSPKLLTATLTMTHTNAGASLRAWVRDVANSAAVAPVRHGSPGRKLGHFAST